MVTIPNILFERLTRSTVEYVANSALGGPYAEVEFIGYFEGQPVLWNATIIALKGQPAHSGTQYIEVDKVTGSEQAHIKVEIGLLVSEIDEPTVIKVIKMIRQFKNLSRGRHEFLGANK